MSDSDYFTLGFGFGGAPMPCLSLHIGQGGLRGGMSGPGSHIVVLWVGCWLIACQAVVLLRTALPT